MKSIFDKSVSVFNGKFDHCGQVMPLREFLQLGETYKPEIERIRAIQEKKKRDEEKTRLPMSCIAGVLQRGDKAKGIEETITEPSKLLCIDIDLKENPAMAGQWQTVKEFLSQLPYIAYVGLSVSGNGLWGIIPLKYPQWHDKQYMQLCIYFRELDIILDKNCSNIGRLRCLSYDPAPYINENAVRYEGYYIEQQKEYRSIKPYDGEDNTLQRLQAICEQIEVQGIDLTSDYNDWMRIGFSLASMGEVGRDFYHVVSRNYPGYNQLQTDRKYNQLLRSRKQCGIGTFFAICKSYGL